MNIITNIEKLKTTFLVVLFSITILLLYFLWGDHFLTKKFISNQSVVEPTTNEVQIKKFFKPFRARINFGGGNYTVLYTGIEKIWDEFIESYYSINQTGDIFIESISEEQWNEILNSQSIKFDFGHDIPFDAMKKALGLAKIPGDDDIETISKAAYSTVIKESHFIYDGKNDQYYMIQSDYEHIEILDEISKIEKRNNDNYDPIKKYFGVDNNTLMPYRLKNSMENVSCEQEIQFYESEKNNALAETFFGESFDFVRKIVETNGTIIYMYGYGEKMLTVSNKGYLEYKEELDIENHENADYIDALSIATSYITNHGNWQTLKGTEIYPYLKTTEEVTDGYKFKFGYRINGYPVCYENNEAIEIEVIGKQVVYYKRFILNQKDTIQFLGDENDEESNKNIIRTADILTNNYEVLKAIYAENGYDFTDKSYEETLGIIVKDIKRVDVNYYLADDTAESAEEIILVPSWVFITDKFKMHFNIQTGGHLGWSSLE